jgi:hypothetical protein
VGVERRNHPLLLDPYQPAVGGVGLDPLCQQVSNQRVDTDVVRTQAFGQRLGDQALPDRLGHTARSQ